MRENVVLFDSTYGETVEFVNGLKNSTGREWRAIVCTSNQGRQGIANVLRYVKYFLFPLLIFLQRGKYDAIIGWQEFYGLLFAFYSRLFRVKKRNQLIIKNFIYKPKKGLIGKLYYRFMKYIVDGGYVDTYICASRTMVDYCCEMFKADRERFVYIPFGVSDCTEMVDVSKEPANDYVLSLGRSNRDWDFLIESFRNIPCRLKIVCDELKRSDVPENVEILNDIWDKAALECIYHSRCMVIPIADGRIASGDTVLLQAMSLSKPIIITRPSCLADDYVTDGYNGIIIDKDSGQLAEAVKAIFGDAQLYQTLAENGRTDYLENHTLYAYGRQVGKIVK